MQPVTRNLSRFLRMIVLRDVKADPSFTGIGQWVAITSILQPLTKRPD